MIKMTKIYFRADASGSIGYGHFIRTLALADMLKDEFECTFFTCHPTSYQEEEMKKVCQFVSLNEESHFDDFLAYLTGDEIVVLDNYYYTTDYQHAIKVRGCKLVCVDDMHDKHYISDMVINHGLSDPDLFDCESYTRLCLGPDYALLRKPFLERKNILERNGIVICFGGSDFFDFTSKVITDLLDKGSKDNIIAIVGDAYLPKGSTLNNGHVEYRSRLSANQMVATFCQASLVICSASSVCYEALACGAQVAAGWYVDNQKDLYTELVRQGFVYPLGNLHDGIKGVNDIVSTSKNPFGQVNIKENFIRVFKGLVDSKYLRQVRKKDVDMIYQWINDPVVRACSFNSELIPYENHIKWFSKVLSSLQTRMYVLIADGKSSGQVRINIEDEEAEISYAIASEARGKGYGNSIISLLEGECSLFPSVKKLVAQVKTTNLLSAKVFIRNGFEEVSNEDGVLTYIKTLSH